MKHESGATFSYTIKAPSGYEAEGIFESISAQQYGRVMAILSGNDAHDDLVKALQSVVENWTAQCERNGHLAPQWVKDARAALAKAGAA
jgi:hypothetical protein